jgi:hypothetical protein
VKSFLTHGTLLTLLFAMLTCIEQLYLGGSFLANCPLFRGMLPELDHPKEYEFGLHDWDPVSNWDCPNLSCVAEMLGSKLTALELPTPFSITSEPRNPSSVQSIRPYFANLKWLSVPSESIIDALACHTIISPILEGLALTNNVVGLKTADWLLQVSINKAKYFPSLHKISCYHGVAIQNEPGLLQSLQAAGIEYFEHVLDYQNSLGEENWHPWCYTPEQLDTLAQAKVKA